MLEKICGCVVFYVVAVLASCFFGSLIFSLAGKAPQMIPIAFVYAVGFGWLFILVCAVLLRVMVWRFALRSREAWMMAGLAASSVCTGVSVVIGHAYTASSLYLHGGALILGLFDEGADLGLVGAVLAVALISALTAIVLRKVYFSLEQQRGDDFQPIHPEVCDKCGHPLGT